MESQQQQYGQYYAQGGYGASVGADGLAPAPSGDVPAPPPL
jgi:hypothetical protein